MNTIKSKHGHNQHKQEQKSKQTFEKEVGKLNSFTKDSKGAAGMMAMDAFVTGDKKTDEKLGRIARGQKGKGTFETEKKKYKLNESQLRSIIRNIIKESLEGHNFERIEQVLQRNGIKYKIHKGRIESGDDTDIDIYIPSDDFENNGPIYRSIDQMMRQFGWDFLFDETGGGEYAIVTYEQR